MNYKYLDKYGLKKVLSHKGKTVHTIDAPIFIAVSQDGTERAEQVRTVKSLNDEEFESFIEGKNNIVIYWGNLEHSTPPTLKSLDGNEIVPTIKHPSDDAFLTRLCVLNEDETVKTVDFKNPQTVSDKEKETTIEDAQKLLNPKRVIRFVKFNGDKVDCEITKAVSMKLSDENDNRWYLEQLKDGTFRLLYTEGLVKEFSEIERIDILRS